MQEFQTPICIVGAGPAGAIASLNLSKHKIHHIIIDKAIFPRDKVCGENFDGRVMHSLNRVVPGFFNDLVKQNIVQFTHDFIINVPKGIIPLKFDENSTPRILAKRIDFDQALMNKVKSSPYVKILEGDLVQDYYYSEESIVFQTKNSEIKTNLGLIGCGYQSGLIKNRKLEKHLYFFLRAYYKNIKQINETRSIETYYFDVPVRCCLLICPIPNGEYNIELGINKLDYKKLKIRLEDLMDYFINSHPELKTRFKNSICISKPKGVHLPITTSYKMFSDRNIMYMGASSFCVNPITGMGVGNAMIMGEEASNNAIQCLQEQNYSSKATERYATVAKSRLRNELIANKVVNFFFKHLRIAAPLAILLIKSKMFLKLFSKQDFLKNLFNPSYYLKLVAKK